jgi:hypothetical protein
MILEIAIAPESDPPPTIARTPPYLGKAVVAMEIVAAAVVMYDPFASRIAYFTVILFGAPYLTLKSLTPITNADKRCEPRGSIVPPFVVLRKMPPMRKTLASHNNKTDDAIITRSIERDDSRRTSVAIFKLRLSPLKLCFVTEESKLLRLIFINISFLELVCVERNYSRARFPKDGVEEYRNNL